MAKSMYQALLASMERDDHRRLSHVGHQSDRAQKAAGRCDRDHEDITRMKANTRSHMRNLLSYSGKGTVVYYC